MRGGRGGARREEDESTRRRLSSSSGFGSRLVCLLSNSRKNRTSDGRAFHDSRQRRWDVRLPAPTSCLLCAHLVAHSAGLAVAQAFRKINNPVIKVIVFEKLAVEPSFQLYPIHLSPSGRTSLISLLSPTAFSSLVARSSPRGITHAGILISDTKLRRLFGLEKWEEEYPIFVLRWVLKEVLGEGVEERRGKRSVGVEENELRGKVRLLFDDGTVEEGDLLVGTCSLSLSRVVLIRSVETGAEGISSITRSYLLPSLPLKSRSLPYLTINFKLRSPSLLTPLLPSQNGLNMLLGTTSYSLILVCITGEDAQNATEMAREDSGFTYGIMTVPFFEGWKEMGEEGWKEICLEYLRSDEADGAIGKALVEEWVKGTGGCWEVVSALGEDRNWTSERCVLVGDACHLMPPL